ncbi:unnamed protein product [Phaeothamnion confervicola]
MASSASNTSKPVSVYAANSSSGAKIHILPCKIHHDDTAAVSTYFLPEGDEEKSSSAGGETLAAFRGRKLVGTKTVLPAGVSGVVLRESRRHELTPGEASAAARDSIWAVEASFDAPTIWGHDQAAHDPPLKRALRWMEISCAIHDP